MGRRFARDSDARSYPRPHGTILQRQVSFHRRSFGVVAYARVVNGFSQRGMVFLARTNALNGKAPGLSLRVGTAWPRANSSRQPGKHAGASEALHCVDEAGVTQAVRWRKLTVCYKN